jgi:hypothetical protein
MPAPTAHSVMISDSRLRRYARKFPGSYRAAAARLDKLKLIPHVGHASACLPGDSPALDFGLSWHSAGQLGGQASLVCGGFQPASVQPVVAGKPAKGELRSPDKLKHVPHCAARKLSAVSFQHSALERHEIVAACKEYGGIVIQKRPTERSGLRKELYA